jgi:hypothetical protein
MRPRLESFGTSSSDVPNVKVPDHMDYNRRVWNSDRMIGKGKSKYTKNR